jgi:hypothetical protein
VLVKEPAPEKTTITIQDVQRILEIGRLLSATLKPEEIVAIQKLMAGSDSKPSRHPGGGTKLGNTTVT